jgi:hypothetical protein
MRFGILLALALAAIATGQPSAAPNDYSDPKAWLCRPGQQDACAIDLTSTVVRADGKIEVEKWTPNPKAPVDCFYVYPTVSTDPTPNSDMIPDPAEKNVVAQQFARFGSKCRTFAPMYRQVTLAGLRTMMAPGGRVSFEKGVQYDDVRDAFKYYLDHDNHGRGFVLIGHSQGSFILAELIRQEIDGKPIAAQMISAMLPGTTIAIRKGEDLGGSFQHVPLCRSDTQTGCVIAYSSFRSTIPPPSNTLFGRVAAKDQTAACTNPAALSGGSAPLHSYLSAAGRNIVGDSPPKPWVAPEKGQVSTPWVSVPGMLTAKCATNDNGTYLEITVHGDPAGPRTDDITGDIRQNGQIAANWGLHLIDVNVAIGDLMDLVGKQSKAWRQHHPGK